MSTKRTLRTLIGNIKGKPGKTAYQYALDAGYTGTEEDFAAKLNEGAVESYSKEEADAKFLTTESDPAVPAWAKAAEKPTYTAEEVGADERGAAAAMLTEAKKYTDEEIAELINGAPTTLDTLGEIATAMAENADVVAALNDAIGSKAAAADLTAHINDKSNSHGVTAAQIGAVPTSRTVNGKALSANITLSADDVGASATGHKHTKSEITDFPSTETWTFTLEDGSTVTKAVYVG